MSIYFVRHGQTDWNKNGYLQGRSDVALNEEGIAQAKAAKEALQGIQIERIVCSPLLRTRKTAELINENWGLPIEEDERLVERGFGELEGKHREVWEQIDFWNWDERGYQMESLPQLFERVYQFLDELNEEAKDHHILVVAHGGVSIPYHCYFEDENRNTNLAELILKNCEIAKRESKQIARG